MLASMSFLLQFIAANSLRAVPETLAGSLSVAIYCAHVIARKCSKLWADPSRVSDKRGTWPCLRLQTIQTSFGDRHRREWTLSDRTADKRLTNFEANFSLFVCNMSSIRWFSIIKDEIERAFIDRELIFLPFHKLWISMSSIAMSNDWHRMHRR